MDGGPAGAGPHYQPDGKGTPRRRRWGLGCAGALAALIILIVIISVSTSGGGKKSAPAKPATTPPSAAKTSPSPATKTPSPRPTRASTTFSGDGQYRVGTDIKPGTYRTDGPSDSSIPNCYWEREKDAKGEFGSIIANGNPTGSAVVSILPTDKLFKTQGCKEWVKVG